MRKLLNGPPVQDPIEIRISGSDEQKVFALVDAVKQHMSGVPGIKNISDNWGPRTKKLAVNIDQSRARRAGLTSRDVAVSLQTVLSGFQTTEYREGDELIPVTLRSVEADREDIGKLEGLNIFSQISGQSVPLKQVADIEVVWQPSKILRRDRLKTVTVSSQIEGEITALAIFDQLDVWLEQADDDWPLDIAGSSAASSRRQWKRTNRSASNCRLPVSSSCSSSWASSTRCGGRRSFSRRSHWA